MSAQQLIDALDYYTKHPTDVSKPLSKLNSFNIYQMYTTGQESTILKTLMTHPLMYKGGMIDEIEGGLSRRTIFLYAASTKPASVLKTAQIDSEFGIHVFNGEHVTVRTLIGSTATIDGQKYAVYHKRKNPKDIPYEFISGPSIPLVEIVESVESLEPKPVLVPDINLEEVRSIIVSRSGLVTRSVDTTPLQSESKDMPQEEWYRAVKTKVLSILALFVDDPNLRQLFTSDASMPYWVRVFTHYTYNYMVNYEELEKLGDSLLGSAFIDYVWRYDPTMRADEVNNLKARYVSKQFQAAVSDILGLAKYLRHDQSTIDVDMREDLMEAFAGGLFRVANMQQDGLGYSVVFNFVVAVYKYVDNFDPSLTSKTTVDQIFIAAGWGIYDDKPAQPIVRQIQTETGWTATVALTPKAITILTNEGKWTSGRDPVIGVGEKREAKNAVSDAYDNALTTLNSIGIDERYASAKKFERTLYNNGYNSNSIKAIKQKLQELGFDYAEYKQKKQDNVFIDMMIVGMKIVPKTRYQRREYGKILAHYNSSGEVMDQQDILRMLIDRILAL